MSKPQHQIERQVAGAGIIVALALAGTVGAALMSNTHHPTTSPEDRAIATAVSAADPDHPAGAGGGLFGHVPHDPTAPVRPAPITRASGDPRLATGFGNLRVAPALTRANLTVYPVSQDAPPAPQASASFAVLDEAMGNGTVSVVEPSLSVTNIGPQPTYVPGGEVVPGGNQDQGVATDSIIAPQSHDVSVASFCVEENRSSGPSPQFNKDVAIAMPAVRYAMQVTGGQGQVWSAVAVATNHFDAGTQTGTYHALMQSPSALAAIQPYQDALALTVPQKSAVGAIVVINGKVVCADVYRDPALFAQLWPSLLRSYALQAAMRPQAGTTPVSRETAAGWLMALDHAPGAERGGGPGTKVARVATQDGAGVRVVSGPTLLHEAFWTDAAARVD
ncbi:MAG: hypothetical protein M3Y28_02485 [Armatimonadota bacterium]|nr:hypothetical protein [Armatimonadota bacterium]